MLGIQRIPRVKFTRIGLEVPCPHCCERLVVTPTPKRQGDRKAITCHGCKRLVVVAFELIPEGEGPGTVALCFRHEPTEDRSSVA